jgi:hypothetical protein
MNPKYLQLIKELVALDKNLYRILVNKMLNMDYNHNDNCFFYNDLFSI